MTTLNDRNDQLIEQGDTFFYDDEKYDSVLLCQLDGDLIRCTNLEDYDEVYSFYIHEYDKSKAYL